MSLLELHPNSPDMHEIPSGEDYAKGSSHIVWATVISVVVLIIAITIFVISIHKPPVAAGEVSQIYTHGTHTLSAPVDANGVPTATQPYDQILIMANVQVRNQSDKPIILRDMMTNVTLPDGPRSSFVVPPTDYDRVFLAYPELAKLKTHTLSRDTMIQPGQSIDGMIVSAFHATEQEWSTHKDLSFTFRFQFHPDLVVTPTTPIQVI